MAKKEIYRIGIGINVTGDKESKAKLTTVEKMAEKTEKKMKALDKARASPSAKLNDQASSKIDKLKSKTDKLNNTRAKIKLEAKDEATNIITKAQNKINGWIKTGAKKIISIGLAGTVALGGIGLATSTKTFASFEQGMKNVQAISGATGNEFKQLTGKAKEMGRATSFTARDSADAFYYMGMAGWKTQEMLDAIPGVLNLAAAGGTELATTSDIVTDGLTALGLTAKDTNKFVDIMGATVTNSNTSVELMGETMKYIGSMGGALGVSMEDLSLATGLMANASVKGSMAGTALRGGLTRLIKPTKEVQLALDEYGISLQKTESGSLDLNGTIGVLRNRLSGLDDVTKSTALAQIFGQEAVAGWAAIINASESDFNKLSNAIANSSGKAEEIANVKLDSLTGQWTILQSAVEGAQIELGERLAPYAKQFVTWLTGKMPSITDKIVNTVDYISKHTDTIKSMAITIAGLGVSFSTLSAVGSIGNTISGVSKLTKALKGGAIVGETTKIAGGIKGIGLAGKLLPAIFSPAGAAVVGTIAAIGVAVKANSNLMKKTVSTTAEELGPVEKIMNSMNGNITKSKSEMQKLGLVYEDFGSNIGNDFKSKVEESTKSLMDFQLFINKINLDGVIDEKESSEFDNRINQMFDNAVKTIQEKKEKTQSALSNLFSEDGSISESEQSTLDYFSKKYDTQISAEQKLQDEIYNIKEKAVMDHGKLLDEDIRQIKEKQQQIAKIELEATGGNQDEINYAKNKFKARAEGLDIKDASKLLKESAKERDDAIVEVKAKYDTYIDNLKSELTNPELDAAKRGSLESSLSELEKAKADKIKSQNDLYNSNLDTVYKQNPNLKGQINKYTGEEFTNKDISSQKVMNRIKEAYGGIEQITKSGNYRLYDASKKAWRNLQVSVDENSGEIVGLYDSMNGHCGAYTESMANEVRNLGKAHTDLNTETTEAMKVLSGATINAKGQIVSSNDEIIASLDRRKTSADGVYSGILNINGTPIEIKSNASGTITNMEEVINTILQMPDSKTVTLNSNAKETSSDVNGVTNSVNNVPESKTITFIKKVITKVEEVFTGGKVDKKASGTNSARGGFSTVNESGWELSDRKSVPIVGSYNGNPLTYLSQGTKILNHMQSVNDMKKEVTRQVNNKMSYEQPQVQYQVAQAPQPQVAGVAGLNFGDINVNVGSNEDIDKLIAEATKEVARQLKEALLNIKK